MAQRSTTSEFQPPPPNYVIPQSGVYRNVGRYRQVTAAAGTQSPTGANMSTAPIAGTNSSQYRYIPRVSG